MAQNPVVIYPLGDLIELLGDDWRAAIVHADGNLNKAGFKRNIDTNKKIPSTFLAAFEERYPTFHVPTITPDNTPDSSNPIAASPGDDEAESSKGHKKRKISVFLHEWAGDQDAYNECEADGTLKLLKEFSGPFEEGGQSVAPILEVPEGLASDDHKMIDLWNAIYEVNSRPYYDPERLALGSLNRSEYFLVPSDWKIEICPIEAVGAGQKKYEVSVQTMAAIYALAKDQARALKMSDDDQVKWALLRLVAFKYGWFANQEYTMYKRAPNGSLTTMLGDRPKLTKLIKQAYSLCSFLPFMTEYHFRAFGAAYVKSNSSDYLSRAQVLAASASLSGCLSYMDRDTLHGKALAWIGVKRPMQVLRDATAMARVPSPFRIRAFSAPAGQGLISNSIAVIDSIRAAGWWEMIKSAGGYDDTVLVKVGADIAQNPWRYHMMYQVYGETAPDGNEAKDLDDAKKVAIKLAPILQAYAVTVMKKFPLGKITALKKHAAANNFLFLCAKSSFVKVLKGHSKDVFLNLHQSL